MQTYKIKSEETFPTFALFFTVFGKLFFLYTLIVLTSLIWTEVCVRFWYL